MKRLNKEEQIYRNFQAFTNSFDMWLYLRNEKREMKLFKKWTLADAVNHSSMKAADK